MKEFTYINSRKKDMIIPILLVSIICVFFLILFQNSKKQLETWGIVVSLSYNWYALIFLFLSICFLNFLFDRKTTMIISLVSVLIKVIFELPIYISNGGEQSCGLFIYLFLLAGLPFIIPSSSAKHLMNFDFLKKYKNFLLLLLVSIILLANHFAIQTLVSHYGSSDLILSDLYLQLDGKGSIMASAQRCNITITSMNVELNKPLGTCRITDNLPISLGYSGAKELNMHCEFEDASARNYELKIRIRYMKNANESHNIESTIPGHF